MSGREYDPPEPCSKTDKIFMDVFVTAAVNSFIPAARALRLVRLRLDRLESRLTLENWPPSASTALSPHSQSPLLARVKNRAPLTRRDGRLVSAS
jgi:hypothetical protein